MTKKDEVIIRKCDRKILRYMTGVKWQDGVSSEEVAKRCSLGDILKRTRQGRLQWLGHVRREGEEWALRMVEKMQVQGNRLPERQLVQGNMKKLGLKEEQAMDQKSLKRLIKGPPIAGKEKDCGRK